MSVFRARWIDRGWTEQIDDERIIYIEPKLGEDLRECLAQAWRLADHHKLPVVLMHSGLPQGQITVTTDFDYIAYYRELQKN